MRVTRRLLAALAVSFLLAGSTTPATSAEQEELNPWVSAAVQVSVNPDPARGHSTPLITRTEDRDADHRRL